MGGGHATARRDEREKRKTPSLYQPTHPHHPTLTQASHLAALAADRERAAAEATAAAARAAYLEVRHELLVDMVRGEQGGGQER